MYFIILFLVDSHQSVGTYHLKEPIELYACDHQMVQLALVKQTCLTNLTSPY